MTERSQPTATVTLLPGDGIGPEVVEAARIVVEASGALIQWDERDAGTEAVARHGTPLPDDALESIRRTRVALKGPLATSPEMAFGSPNVALRERLGLHTTVRPCRAVPGPGVLRPDLDVVVVKMNHEDLYARLGLARGAPETRQLRALLGAEGAERIADDAAVSLRPLSVRAVKRVVEAAFQYASANGRRRVTAVHKEHLIPHSDGLFLEVAREVAAAHAEIELDDALVDTVCERLVSRPGAYDVLVMPRMYGDIVSGVGASLIGGPGMAAGVNLGDGCTVFEAVHGTAPRLAGTGRANPIALIRTATLLLRHIGQRDAADRIETAVADVVRAGRPLTYDLAPDAPASTGEVAAAVVERLVAAA